jgi:hypothetical protein
VRSLRLRRSHGTRRRFPHATLWDDRLAFRYLFEMGPAVALRLRADHGHLCVPLGLAKDDMTSKNPRLTANDETQ